MIDFHFCFEAVLKPGHKAVVTETWAQQLCGVGWRQAAFVSISHTRACSPPESCPTLLWPPWNADCQAPLSRGFPSKSIGMGCYFLLQGMDLPDPGIEPASPGLAGRFFTTEPSEKPSSVPRTCFFFFFPIPAPNSFHNPKLLHSHPENPFTFKRWFWCCCVNAGGKVLFVSVYVPHSSWKNWHSANSDW